MVLAGGARSSSELHRGGHLRGTKPWGEGGESEKERGGWAEK